MPIILLGMGAIGFVAAYWGIWTHTFEGDDFFYFAALDQIQTPSDIFSTQAFGRPIVDLVMWGMYQIFERSPAPYHLLLVFLHLAATGMVYVTTRDLGTSVITALLASVFFAINVSHFRATHWVSCMGYPLALFFGLACARAIDCRAYVRSLSFLILGVLSHPGIALAPLAAFRTRPIAWKPLLIHGSAGILTASLLTRLYDKTPQAQMFSLSAWEFLVKTIWYLGRSVTAFADVFPDMQEIYTSDIIAGSMLLCACCLLAYRRSFWAIWIILSIVPFASNSAWSYFATGPSRHLYFASVAISIGAAAFVSQAARWNRPAALALAAGLITICAWQHQISRAHSAYLEGRGHIAHKDPRVGAERLAFAHRHAATLIPQDAVAHAGVAMLGEGLPLDQLLTTEPQDPWTDMLRGVNAIIQNDPEMTREYLLATANATKEVSDLALDTARALNNLAAYYYGQKDFERAEKVARIALTFAPDYENAIKTVRASQKQRDQRRVKPPLDPPNKKENDPATPP